MRSWVKDPLLEDADTVSNIADNGEEDGEADEDDDVVVEPDGSLVVITVVAEEACWSTLGMEVVVVIVGLGGETVALLTLLLRKPFEGWLLLLFCLLYTSPSPRDS